MVEIRRLLLLAELLNYIDDSCNQNPCDHAHMNIIKDEKTMILYHYSVDSYQSGDNPLIEVLAYGDNHIVREIPIE